MKRLLFIALAAFVSLLATSCETVDYDYDDDDDDGYPAGRRMTVEETRVMRY